MTIEEMEKEIARRKAIAIEEYKAKPKVKPLLEFSLKRCEGPLFSLLMRCLNIEALKEQQKQDFNVLGHSSLMVSDYSEAWRHQMSYVLTKHDEVDYLVYCSGGNIHTKTDKACFGYVLTITEDEKKAIEAEILPISILSEKRYCDIANK